MGKKGIFKYGVILIGGYTALNVVFGKLQWRDIPGYIISRTILLVVLMIIALTIGVIVSKLFKRK
jgi:hypothetical protein